METQLNGEMTKKIDQINLVSENLIRDSYLAGRCPGAMWITGLDDEWINEGEAN